MQASSKEELAGCCPLVSACTFTGASWVACDTEEPASMDAKMPASVPQRLNGGLRNLNFTAGATEVDSSWLRA